MQDTIGIRTAEAMTEEERSILKLVRRFAADRVLPLAGTIDRDDALPREMYRELGDLGLLGVFVPEAYGGTPLSTLLFSAIVEEIAAASAAVANAMCASVELSHFMATHASEEQCRRWIPGIVSGDLVPAFALTEPEAGSDISQVRLTARRVGGGWRLDGAKSFITSARIADVCVVFGRTGGEGRQGMSAFLVRGDSPGVTRGEKSPSVGIRGLDTAQMFFEECFVPDADLVGEVGDGYALALSNIAVGRIAMGSEALGIARAALELAVDYATSREQFGSPVFKFQGVSFPLADLATRVDASRLLLHRAARLRDAGLDFRVEASMAKLSAAEIAMDAANEAMLVFGAYGYLLEAPIQRLFRDAKLTQIYEGSRNVQRMIIGQGLRIESAQRKARRTRSSGRG